MHAGLLLIQRRDSRAILGKFEAPGKNPKRSECTGSIHRLRPAHAKRANSAAYSITPRYRSHMILRAEPINPTIGDLAGNANTIRSKVEQAAADKVDLVVFPECALTGYPPRDLLREPSFIESTINSAHQIAKATESTNTVAVVGSPWGNPKAIAQRGLLYNSALVIRDGKVTDRYDKQLLPTYDIFDESRYFQPGTNPLVLTIAGRRVGVLICEDLWRGADVHTTERYNASADPVRETIQAGADLLCVLNASPFILGKSHLQSDLLSQRAVNSNADLIAVNQCGANDDLIFDGHAAIITANNGKGTLVACSSPFNDDAITANLTTEPKPAQDPFATLEDIEQLWHALVLGVRDYARKSGFTSACLGLSGGIDSAITAAIAAAALGPDNVFGVLMPSQYSSDHSITDAEQLARNLNINTATAPILQGHNALSSVVADALSAAGKPGVAGITDENIQSRLRGLIMMGISNATGALLLTTGNKSEHAVGYATLYGDMNGGLAPIADVLKTSVYDLCRWLNNHPTRAGFSNLARTPEGAVIPKNTLEKPPSAELRPDQTDQDSLPEYDVLDRVIQLYVEAKQGPESIIHTTNFDAELVYALCAMIDRAEFKRFQLCVALKVSSVAFGPGRRRPIAQQWTSSRTRTRRDNA